MNNVVSERNFESSIEQALLASGPDADPQAARPMREAAASAEFTPGGYRRRKPEAYDRHNCLIPEVQRLYEGNLFAIVRQLRYSEKSENSLDLALFVNGLPIFTAELKNPLTGQDVQDGIRQYRFNRDPKEPLFAFGRCLAHFAVDPDLVYMTTHLKGAATAFLPFNQGRNGGAGNPPAWRGYATAYLWQEVWAKESVLDLIQHFMQVVELEDDKGRKTGERELI